MSSTKHVPDQRSVATIDAVWTRSSVANLANDRRVATRNLPSRTLSASRGARPGVRSVSFPKKGVTMAATIPEKFLDLFQKKAFANLATLMPDGSPQVTPVWIDYDGSHLLVNTARGRQKDKNMQANGKVSLAILDPDNPYRYIEIRGKVDGATEQGADAHIDKMAMKYMGKDKYPYHNPKEKRVIYKILPTKTTQMG
jgi:PPOX class probable F420-dependent enzyme